MGRQAVSAQRVVVYADARQRGKREGWTASLAGALKSLRWQSAAFAPLLYGGSIVGLLTAIYKVGEVPYEAETTFLTALASQAATAAVLRGISCVRVWLTLTFNSSIFC